MFNRAPGKLLLNKKYMNQDFGSFLDVAQSFLKEANLSKPPLTACFAVAGPVSNNSVTFTNRENWSIEGGAVADKLGIRKVRLINDFLAVGKNTSHDLIHIFVCNTERRLMDVQVMVC